MSALVDGAVTAAIKNVRDDASSDDWVLVGYSGPEQVALLGTGTGGIEALKGSLPENDICYGLLRKEHTWETAGSVNAKTIKHVWLYWFPDTTPLARKRKVGVFEGQIKRMFAPYHAEMHPSSLAEVSEAQLAALLDSITMRVDKTGNEKATGAALGARTSVATVDRQKTKGFLPTGTGADTAKAAAGAAVTFDDPAAFKTAIKAVSSNDAPDDWCLVGYKDQKTLQVIGHGTGGLEALLEATQDGIINYGMIRVSDKHDMTNNVMFCFIAWQPEDVPPMVKARASTHRGAVASAFREHQPFHFEFRATTKTDLTPAMVVARIGECTGSKSMVGDATKPVTPQQGGKSPVAVSPSAIAAAAAGLSSLTVSANGGHSQSSGGGGHSDDKQQQQQLLFEDEAAVRDAIARVRNDDDPAEYCVAVFTATTKLKLEDLGQGGTAAVTAKLPADSFAYALVRVKETIDASETVKFCFVKWSPEEGVAPAVRGRLGVLSGAVAKVFQPYHGDLVISDKTELTESAIMSSVSNLRARNKA